MTDHKPDTLEDHGILYLTGAITPESSEAVPSRVSRPVVSQRRFPATSAGSSAARCPISRTFRGNAVRWDMATSLVPMWARASRARRSWRVRGAARQNGSSTPRYLGHCDAASR